MKEVGFNENYSLVVKFYSIRPNLALVAHLDLELEPMDLKTSFLYGELEETIYMSQHESLPLRIETRCFY